MLTCCAATLTASASGAPGAQDDGRVAFADAQLCQPRAIALPAALRAASGARFEAEADEIESRDDALRLRGNARLLQGARGLFAEEILFHRAARRAEAAGDVALYTARGDVLRAERVELDLDDFAGEAHDVHITFADAPGDGAEIFPRARARASRVAFEGDALQHLEDAQMSGCVHDARPVEQQDVVLRAKRITLDHARGFGSAKSMTLKFKRVPIFYFPRVTFPIDDRRKTGFLFPSAGYANDSGMLIETPFYLNLAPHYDARLTPRLLSRRGAQLAGQFRYLSAHGGGALRAEGMSSDRQFAVAGRGRHALAYRHRYARANWRAAVDLQRVSDRSYLSDFAGGIDAVASSYIARTAELEYRGKRFRLDARAAVYDAANDEVAGESGAPHAVLPRLRVALLPQRFGPFAVEIEAEYANFEHEEEAVQGARWRAAPHLSLPLRKPYGYLVPSASLHAFGYALDDSPDSPDSDEAADAGDPAREAAAPLYALDAGLFFRRDGAAYAQTLEPRLRYLRAPHQREQEDFPVFDTGRGSMSGIAHYFRDNRFIGGDRFGDTEQIAAGIGSRIIRTDDGAQLLHFQLARVFYFKDRALTLEDDAPETENASGLLAEIAARGGGFGINAFARGAAHGGGLDAARLAAGYRKDARRRATLAYLYDNRADDAGDDAEVARTEQLNLAFDAPLGAFRQLRAEVAYSLETDETQSSSLAFHFDGCCWAARIGMQRYLDGAGARKSRFLFTLELDGLGRAGSL